MECKMNKFIISLILALSLVGCATPVKYQVQSTVAVQFAPDAFQCKPKPSKPTKVAEGYKESDVAIYLNRTEAARADCELKLHSAGDTYHKQIDLIDQENEKNKK